MVRDDADIKITDENLSKTEEALQLQRLRESEERYRTLFETMVLGVVYQDNNGKIISANPAAEDMLGLSFDQMQGRTSTNPRWKSIHEDGSDFPGESHPAMVALKTGKKVKNVIMGVFDPKMEETRWININATPQYKKYETKPFQVYSTFEEITERIKAEENYKHLLNYAPTAIYEIDFKGPSFKRVNEALINLSGYSREELLSMNPIDILNPESQKSFQNRIREGLSGKEIADEVEYVVIHKDGHKLWVILNIKPVYKEDKIIGALVVGHDITKRRQVEQLKQDLLEKEQQLIEELTTSNEELKTTTKELNSSNKKLLSYSHELYEINANLEAVLNIAPVVLWIAHDPDCDVITGNDYADQIVMNVPKGENISASAKPETAAVTYKVFRDGVELKPEELPAQIAASTAKPVPETNLDLVFPDGRIVYLQVSAVPLFDELGNVRGSITAGVDITNIKQKEAALRESEEKYRNIVEIANEGIMMADPSGVITFVNAKMAEMLGYTVEELVGTDSLSLLDKDEVVLGKKKIENRKKGIQESYEIKYLRKSGEELWCLINATPMYDYNGKHIANMTMQTDITERKLLEEKLVFQADILSRVQDAIIVTDDNFNIIYWNEIAEIMLGWTEEEALGRNSGELLRTKIENSTRENVIESLNRDSHYVGEVYYLRKDMTYLPVEINVKTFSNEKGEVTTILTSIRDISDRKQSELKIQQKQKLLDSINKLFQEYLTTETVKEVVEKCLEVVEELTESEFGFFGEINENGRLNDRALSPPAWDVCETTNARELLNNMEIVSYWGRTIKEEKSQIVNNPDSDPDRRGLPDGHPPITSFLGVPLKEGEKTIGMIALANKKSGYTENDKKNVEALSVAFVEVLMRKRAEIEIKENLKNLTLSNKELEQFAYITSHDLREPLRMITSFLQLLERRYKDQLDQDANEFIGFAVDGAKRLDAMTNDLLQYSKISSQKREIIPVNFEHVLEEALINLKVPIEENKAIITHDPLPIINGDEQLKVQLFQNIIGNAVKYRSQETPKIHISATKEKNHYLFSIKDNGIGMSPEHLKKIFTIFQRLHTHEEYEGTGIGLAIAQKIVHQQGGEIWAESGLGKGSTFYFTIPIK